ncbi:hypothetical protein LNP00_03880 [Fructobacillus sp. M158]|uniref:hypothetical protein n=1 Tax=Fructobacillus parabroussonetiae TaxID=2713174 RepID=UPI00200B1F1F|nr:hypothetical protein [Fructobacillus parabroussonetiae]MCK8617503.1 hypothetical protein [Fructobacillus parabroussonetiae]
MITAYHGTSKMNAKQILEKGFRIKRDEKLYPNDLGHGIYGYVDSDTESGDTYLMQSAKESASLFAKQIRKIDEKHVAILRMDIEIDRTEYLDLNEVENRNHVVRLYQEVLADLLIDIRVKYAVNRSSRRKQMDGVVLEKLNQDGLMDLPEVIIKDTYTRFSGILSNFTNGREIVIRDPKVIKAIRLLNV